MSHIQSEFVTRAVQRLEPLARAAEHAARTTVELIAEGDDATLALRPMRDTAAKVVVDIQDGGTIVISMGDAGLLTEIGGDTEDAVIDEAESIVDAIVQRGLDEWIAPTPSLTGDPRGVLEIPTADGATTVTSNATPLALLTARRRWNHRHYEPY